MSLSPSASLELGSLGYTAHLAEVRVTLRLLPGVNTVTAVLPREAELDAAPGDPATLALDGGEGGETVLTGTVRGLRHGLRR